MQAWSEFRRTHWKTRSTSALGAGDRRYFQHAALFPCFLIVVSQGFFWENLLPWPCIPWSHKLSRSRTIFNRLNLCRPVGRTVTWTTGYPIRVSHPACHMQEPGAQRKRCVFPPVVWYFCPYFKMAFHIMKQDPGNVFPRWALGLYVCFLLQNYPKSLISLLFPHRAVLLKGKFPGGVGEAAVEN